MTHISLKNVNVQIPVYDSHGLRLIKLPSFGRARVGTNTTSQSGGVLIMHAIKDLSLEINEGDRVCLIGHNGAGKTTLLRLIAGIYPSKTGSVSVEGKVFALLSGSMALNRDATGYENIRLIANLYGWPEETYQAQVREIEEFTELGEYLSLPTRIYSAGMHARLAFALATAHSPDILLVDEGMGAGDANFQKKAKERIDSFISRARIIVLATHAAELARRMCNKALLMSNGEGVFFGDLDEAFNRYAQLG
jgi:ABC-type polysaccharide/polyol phosphate transport system ATPase subunit